MEDELEKELGRERENSNRLAAALAIAMAYLSKVERDELRATVIGPFCADYPAQLTVGHVVDGAFALHKTTKKGRSEI